MLSIVTDKNNLLMRRSLCTATNAVNIALQRMSTGYKVNSAKDDAAGMYIATRLNTQINGLKQAQKNVQDGISILQTAEGAYSNITDILQRLRELTLQASNGIYDETSRNAMQAEADQLTAELRRIQEGTSFNGLSLFNNPPSESAVATPALANTLNILDMSTSGNGVAEPSANSGSTFSLLRSSAPMMMSASPTSTSGNEGIALMSVEDGGATPASTITSTAYDFTANQTQTITVGEGEHQRTYTVRNKQATTSSITVNYDTSTGQITFLGQNFEIKATEMDKTHNLIINGGTNTVYTGNMADRVEIAGGSQNYIYGKGGDDELIANVNNGYLYGDDGKDTLHIKGSDSYAYGGNGDDKIYTYTHSGNGYGGEGNDIFYSSATGTSNRKTTLAGEAGDDKFYITSTGKYLSIDGGSGYNQIEDLGTNNTRVNLYDFEGNDVSTLYAVDFTGKGHTQTITIDGKNYEVTCDNNSYKTLYYSVKDGVITFDKLSAQFIIKGQKDVAHNVILNGSNLTFYGGDKDDKIQGGYTVYGGKGDDEITATTEGTRFYYGEEGNDKITWTGAFDYGNSIIDGGADNDIITVKSATYSGSVSKIWGGIGNDIFNITGKGIVVSGNEGNDTYNFGTGSSNNIVIDSNDNGDSNILNANGTNVITSGFDDSKASVITIGAGETKEVTLLNGITYQIKNNYNRENQLLYYYDEILFETTFAGSNFEIVGEENKVHNIKLYGNKNVLKTANLDDIVTTYGIANTIYTYDGNDQITHDGYYTTAIYAGNDDDTITINSRQDAVVNGEDGKDKFVINSSASKINGGAGDDEYVLNKSANITDTDGNNIFEINANNCTATGGTGNDTFTVNGTGNTINAAAGNDYVLLNGTNNTVLGGTGTNYYVATTPEIESSNSISNTVVNPNSGAIGFTTTGAVETFEFNGQIYTVKNIGADGTSTATNTVTYNYNQNTGELTLSGSNFTVTTENANQNLVIKGSNNNITTGSGNDNVVVSTGEGNVINTNAGADKITTNTANNAISGGEGNDTITLNGSSGSKLVDAGEGDNTITINSNDNTNVIAGNGKNNLTVSGQTNTITLGDGENTAVMTGTGNTLTAGNGNNKLSSVNGGNTISVGSGNNTLGLQGNNNTATTLGGTNTFNINGDENTVNTQGNGTYNITGTMNNIDTAKSGTFNITGDENIVSSAMGNGTYSIKGDNNEITAQQGDQDVSINGDGNVYTSLSGSSEIDVKGNLNILGTTNGINSFEVKGNGNEIVGGTEADEIEVSGNSNIVSGNDGDDYILVGGGADNQLDGGAGENIMINGGANTNFQNVIDMTPTPLHVRLQVGANAEDSIEFDLSFNLFNFEVDLTDIDSSLDSLADIDEMLNNVSKERSNVGAIMNRLESVINSQTISIENFTASKSTIMDADIAKESAEYVKNQILQQTTAALIAQAGRSRADIIMRLLR